MKHKCGSIMVLGCFLAARIRDPVRINEITKDKYRKILETNAVPSELRSNSSGFIFVQYNDPKYFSKLC